MKQHATPEPVRFNDISTRKAEAKMQSWFYLGGVLLSLALLFCIMSFNLQRTYQTARSSVIELSKNCSNQNAENIEFFFSRHEDVLMTTAEVFEYGLTWEDFGADEAQELLRNISITYNDEIYKDYVGKEFTGIYAAVDGVLIHGLKTPEDLPEDYDPLIRPWYREAVAGQGSVIFGEPYQDIYTSHMVMSATKLLKDGKTVVGMDITLDDLQFAGGNMDVSVTLNGREHVYGYGFVLTNHGIVMAHSNQAEQGICYDDPSSPMHDLFQQIKQYAGESKGYFETSIGGINHAVFPHRLSNGWYVVTLTDIDDITASISEFSTLVILGTAVVVLIALLYCVLITRAYIKSKKLTENLSSALALTKRDTLTGYSNRTAYDMRVRDLQEKLETEDDISFAVLMMDLNDLKYVNDHYGHAIGDQYIRNSCRLVRDIIPSELYRFGGDEFALFLTGDVFDRWEESFERLQQAVTEANLLLVPNVEKPSIAIGMAIHIAGSGDDMDALLRQADAAMYANKAAIKQVRLENSEHGCTPNLKKQLLGKQQLVSEMQMALEKEQFEVWLQPQVNHTRGGALIGAEALVRWRHPERGMVSPAVFIPILEYNGLIYELDKYVWKHSCAYIRHWLDTGMTPMPISVNVSRLDILRDDFVETITSIVEQQHIPCELIHLEITESAFTDSADTMVEIVKELIDRGFTIAIDDFGSGYSSLSMLKSVPAHILKLDMRFFADQENEARNECIIESIVKMAKMLGMAVLAEGVEHAEQANLLQLLGCDYIQGFLYSKPLPYADYMAYVRAAESKQADRPNVKNLEETETDTVHSRDLFRTIISGTNDIIIVADRKTKQLLYANHAAEQYYGKGFDPMIVTTCSEYCQRGAICENCPANHLKLGERKELVLTDKDAHMKALYTRMDWNGHDAFVFYQTDISAEMREMELADSLIKNIPAAMVIMEFNESGKVYLSYVSEQARTIFHRAGLTTENPKAEECLRLIHPDDREQVRSAAVSTFAQKTKFHQEFRVMLDGDVIMWLEHTINSVADSNGNYRFYSILSDITDRRNAQARADMMIQNLPIALTVFSADERIFLSDSAKRILGSSDHSRQRVALETAYGYIHPDDVHRVRNVGTYCMEHKVPVSSQFRVRGEDGVYRWVQLDTTPILRDDGGYLYYGIYTDLSMQKQLEDGVHDYELNQHSSLMNNLGVGIVVFRGDSPNELTPVFCNKEYMRLSGLNYEEFQMLLTKNCLYGVHPDDIDEARRRFADSFRSKRSLKHRLRVQKKDGRYEWVSMHANIRHMETGGFEVYMLFSDAEEEMRKLAIDTERYKNFIERTTETTAGSLSLLHMNLTTNTCHSIRRSISVNRPAVFEDGPDEFIFSVADNVASAECQKEFIAKFSSAALLANFDRGIFFDKMRLPIRLTDQRTIWCYQTVSISKNPATGHIEAIMNLTEADRDIRLAEHYKRLIASDYEFVGNIDTETGLVTTISEPNSHGLPDISKDVLPYTETLGLRVAALVDDEFVDTCIEAMSYATLLKKLETQEIYTCTFPAKQALLGRDGVFQWRFGYVNQSNTEILFSRKELKGFLDTRHSISAVETEAQERKRLLGEAAKEGKAARNTILIADDVAMNRDVLRLIFEDTFNIVQAADGEEAIDLIDRYHDSLAIILLDLVMPKKSGIDVLIHLNMRGLNHYVPVIMVTGTSPTDSRLHSLEYGISDIISKPFDSKLVKRRALNLIELYAHKEDAERQLEAWKQEALKTYAQGGNGDKA